MSYINQNVTEKVGKSQPTALQIIWPSYLLWLQIAEEEEVEIQEC